MDPVLRDRIVNSHDRKVSRIVASRMLSEEEFTVYQTRQSKLHEENFQLKDEVRDLAKRAEELPRLQAQWEGCEKDRQEIRARHMANIEVLREELNRVKENAIKEATVKAEQIETQIATVDEQIAGVERERAGKEDRIIEMQKNAKTTRTALKKELEVLEQKKKEDKKWKPLLAMIKGAAAMPMYIEDLTAKLESLRARVDAKQAARKSLSEKVNEGTKTTEALNREIGVITTELQEKETRLRATRIRIEDTQRKIAAAREDMDKARAKVDAENEMARQRKEARDVEINEIVKEKEETQKKIDEWELQRAELQRDLDAKKMESDAELQRQKMLIRELRTTVSMIQSTEEGKEIPRVDIELREQMDSVIADRHELNEKSLMIRQALQLVRREIKAKDAEIRSVTLNMAPNPRITSTPEFKEKQLLLEELVLQNGDLSSKFTGMTERIAFLRVENGKMAAQIRAKMKKRGLL